MDEGALSGALQEVNAVQVGADEMVQLIAAIERFPPKATHEDAGQLVRQLFPMDTPKQRAVLLRCHALMETIDRECPWLEGTGSRDTLLVEPAMSAAAASCELVICNGALQFRRDQFLRYTLAAVKPVGHA
ncbi:MAG TPA: hypothetical protein PLN91_00585 [Rhodanobacteraceae bacterium]|nr:hypothetical protein [Rhodanobacteraceae bacterium]